MRIALLSEAYPPDIGGLAVSAERLAHGLASAGHSMHVFAPGQAAGLHPPGVTVERFPARRRVDDKLADWFDLLVARQRAEQFDLLHAYFMVQAGFVATYAGRFLGLPAVVSARGNDLDRAVFDPARAAHVLYALQHATAITANSRDLVRKACALAPGHDVTYIPNGVDATRFSPAAAAIDHPLPLALAPETPILGFVGEARAKKGLATLLLAFRELAHQRPVALLLIGGVRPGDDQAMLAVFQKQHPDLPLAVIPYVQAEALPSYYNLLDLLLLPSLRDGLPNALLEGMACGCAIVATPAGGIPDALRHGENGLLVPPGNSQALAGAIRSLLDDPPARARLGQAARATVLHDFSIQQEIAGNLALYRRLSEVSPA